MIFGLDAFAYNIFASGRRIDIDDVIFTWEEICNQVGDWMYPATAANTYNGVALANNSWVPDQRAYEDEYFSIPKPTNNWTDLLPDPVNTIKRC